MGVFWAVCAGLLLIDVTTHRIPDIITIPAGIAALVYCVWHPEAAWGLMWPATYLLLPMGGIGGGDIKLALPLGVVVAQAASVPGVLAAVGLAGLMTGVVGVMGRRKAIAHGPSMILAAGAVTLFAHLAG